MERRRCQFARNLVHIGDHQQQTLRRRERGRQRAGLQRSVHRSRRAAFALHLSHVGYRSPYVGDPFRSPLVGPLSHGRRRSDRINRYGLVQAIRNVGYRLIRVHGLEFALHRIPSPQLAGLAYIGTDPGPGRPKPPVVYSMKVGGQARRVRASHTVVTCITRG
jgi:hypothetical protein